MRAETRTRIENLARNLKDLCQFRLCLDEDFLSCTLDDIRRVIIDNNQKFDQVEKIVDLLMETATEWEKDDD